MRTRLGFIVVLLILSVAIVAPNADEVTIEAFFWAETLPISAALGIALLVGIVIGILLGRPWRRPRKKPAAKAASSTSAPSDASPDED